jgi:hypothetical protein
MARRPVSAAEFAELAGKAANRCKCDLGDKFQYSEASLVRYRQGFATLGSRAVDEHTLKNKNSWTYKKNVIWLDYFRIISFVTSYLY